LVVHQTIGVTISKFKYLDCSGLAAVETLLTRAEATGQTVSRTGPPMLSSAESDAVLSPDHNALTRVRSDELYRPVAGGLQAPVGASPPMAGMRPASKRRVRRDLVSSRSCVGARLSAGATDADR
jgi:hypothetical protein